MKQCGRLTYQSRILNLLIKAHKQRYNMQANVCSNTCTRISIYEQRCVKRGLNSLPNYKFLDQSKLKAFADDKINVTEKLLFVLGCVETIVEKVENASYQHFLLFPQCFQEPSFSRSLKVWILWFTVNAVATTIYPCLYRLTMAKT